MKIGILGGTFNPVHKSHTHMAQDCFAALALDKLLLVPTFMPPHKSANGLADANARLAMCRLAVSDIPSFAVCDYEISQQDKSYTYRTLEFLQESYADAEFFLLMGADMFLTIQDWRNPQDIYKMATLCAVQREQGEFDALNRHAEALRNAGARCVILQSEPAPLSSTQIRECIKAGGDVSAMLDARVWQYIKEHGIYGA